MYEHQTSYMSYCRLSEEFPALMCVPSKLMSHVTQPMADVCVAECYHELNILYVKKGGMRVGVGRPTDGGKSIWG